VAGIGLRLATYCIELDIESLPMTALAGWGPGLGFCAKGHQFEAADHHTHKYALFESGHVRVDV
jgi:hypothetical protein